MTLGEPGNMGEQQKHLADRLRRLREQLQNPKNQRVLLEAWKTRSESQQSSSSQVPSNFSLQERVPLDVAPPALVNQQLTNSTPSKKRSASVAFPTQPNSQYEARKTGTKIHIDALADLQCLIGRSLKDQLASHHQHNNDTARNLEAIQTEMDLLTRACVEAATAAIHYPKPASPSTSLMPPPPPRPPQNQQQRRHQNSATVDLREVSTRIELAINAIQENRATAFPYTLVGINGILAKAAQLGSAGRLTPELATGAIVEIGRMLDTIEYHDVNNCMSLAMTSSSAMDGRQQNEHNPL